MGISSPPRRKALRNKCRQAFPVWEWLPAIFPAAAPAASSPNQYLSTRVLIDLRMKGRGAPPKAKRRLRTVIGDLVSFEVLLLEAAFVRRGTGGCIIRTLSSDGIRRRSYFTAVRGSSALKGRPGQPSKHSEVDQNLEVPPARCSRAKKVGSGSPIAIVRLVMSESRGAP